MKSRNHDMKKGWNNVIIYPREQKIEGEYFTGLQMQKGLLYRV